MVRQKTEARRKRRRPILRVTAPSLRVDLGSAFAATWGGVCAAARYVRRVWSAPPVQEYAWHDAPSGALLIARRHAGSCFGGSPLFVRDDERAGCVVGHLTSSGKPRCDDWRECVGWDVLGLKHSEPDVVVLATDVSPDLGGAELERLASLGLAKLDGGAT